MRTLAFSLSLGLAWIAGWATEAAAQQLEDFATCGPDLVQCDSETSLCCYRSFQDADPDTPRAIVIPMDRCHQRIGRNGKLSPPGESSPAWCRDPGASADEGMFQAYGLVYRLTQHDIPVQWVINPTKDPPALTNDENLSSQTYTERDIDAWILSQGTSSPPAAGSDLTDCASAGCEPPVSLLDPATLSPQSGSYTAREFPLRGGAFVIAPEHRERFDDFWNLTGEFSDMDLDPTKYDFSAVDLYEMSPDASFAYQDYRTPGPNYSIVAGGGAAPVALTLDYDPPRLARLTPAGVSEIWLEMAKLDDPAQPGCLTGDFQPADAVYCDISEEQIRQGFLVDGDFRWAWIDNWSDNSPCGSDAELSQHEKLEEFLQVQPGVRAAGNVFLMEAAVGVAEGCPDHEFMGVQGTGLATDNTTAGEPLILRHPQNLFMQYGDVPSEFATGAVAKWNYYGSGAVGYDPSHVGDGGTLRRLVTEDQSGTGNTLCTNHVSTSSCDVFENRSDADVIDVASYLRYRDDPQNGVVFYMAGNQVNNTPSQLRMVLNAFISLPSNPDALPEGPVQEVSRASSIVATVDGVEAQYQGTYEVQDPAPPMTTFTGAADADSFKFPYRLGHLRAIPTEAIAESGTDYDSEAALFDAAEEIPAPTVEGCSTHFGASCRTVFTNVEGGPRPDRVFLNTSNVEELQAALAPDLTAEENATLISRILAGYDDDGDGTYEPKLGGIDRSTVAVIEPSPMVGNDRPTIIYAGAHDGMLHAFCADTVGPCTRKGQELWAFIPRTQLPVLKENVGRIDGSPKVSDVFGDFNGDGLRQWRTVLTFQTGSGEPGFAGKQPAVYAIDITEPDDPQILWEVSTAEQRGPIELGVGTGLAMGRVRSDGALVNATFVQTNNGGAQVDGGGRPGFYLAAIDTASGELLWEQGYQYPEPPRGDGDNPPVPSTGIPGGVAAIDRNDSGTITDLVVPSLYGEMWLVDAATGDNRLGGIDSADRPLAGPPLFSFEENHHPIGATPTIYRDRLSGTLHAVAVSGGYVDPVGSSWAPAGVDQYAVSVSLETSPSTAPITDTADGDFGGLRAFTINVGTNRAYSQAVIAGNELFIVTDSDDVNASTYGTGGVATGVLGRYSLGGGLHAAGEQVGDTVAIRGGAGAVDVTGDGVVYSGSGDQAQKVDHSADHDADGDSVEVQFTQKQSRRLWLRTQ